MIRRLLAVAAIAIAALVVSASPSGAANGNVACVYGYDPTPIGLCIGL